MSIPNIVPRGNDDGETLGTALKQWSNVHTKELTLNGSTLSSLISGKVDTSTYNTKMTSLDGSITTLSSQKVDKVIGEVIAFAGSTCPSDYLFCDGSAISRVDYKTLFDVIGTSYGVGDGSTTFNLPNLVDKFIQGNSTVGSIKSAGLPNIEAKIIFHSSDTATNVHNATGAFYSDVRGSGYRDGGTTGSGSSYIGTVNMNASLSSSIYGNSTTVQPPAVTMQYIIRYE